MNAFCPNLSDPQIKQEFTELVQAVGEDAAYFLWNKNNGYSLDRAPNGAPSKLFSDLVTYYNGDRMKAVETKGKVYTQNFKNWFGDWQSEDKTNVSKVIDENGEPQIMWHGTEYIFDTFELDLNNERGKHLVHPNVAFWFTDRRDKAEKYRHKYQIPVFLSFKIPAYSNIMDFKTINDALKNESELLLDDRYDSVIMTRFDKEGDKHGIIPTTQWAAKNPNQIKSIENYGEFSTEYNNIYRTEISRTIVNLNNAASKSLFDTGKSKIYSNDVIQSWMDKDLIPAELKPLAKVLQKHNIVIRFTKSVNQNGFMAMGSEKKGGHVHVIYINENMLDRETTEYTIQSLLHEMMHAISTEEIDTNPKGEFTASAKRLFDIYRNYYRDRIGIDRDLYGLTDLYEFVAEYLTNSKFRNKLLYAAKEIDDSKTGIRNVLRKFINAILNVFCNKHLYGDNEKQLQEYRTELFNHALNYKQINNSGALSVEELNNIIEYLDEAVIDTHNMLQTSKHLKSTITMFHNTVSVMSKLDKRYNTEGKGAYLKDNQKAKPKTYTKNEAEQVLQNIENEIASTLDIRIKAVSHSKMSVDTRKRVIDGLRAQHDAFVGNTMTALQSLVYFLETTAPDLINEAEKIKSAVDSIYETGHTTFNLSDYNESMHDYFGVYKDIYNSLSKLFSDPAFQDWINSTKTEDSGHFHTLDDFTNTINLARSIVHQSEDLLKYLRDFNLKNKLADLGESTANSMEMQEFLDQWNDGVIFNDTSAASKVFGAADKNSDVMVRSAAHLIKNATDIAVSQATSRIVKLSSIAQNLKRGHKITDIYEKDDENLPTGNLVRKYNYGKFRKDRAKFLKELNAKYSTEEEPLAPDNIKQPKNKKYRVQWAKEYNEWMDKHANRRYTKEYYDMFAELSWEAYNARNEIQSTIRAVKSKYWNENKQYFDYETVPDGVDADKWIKQRDEDVDRLNQLYAQRRELASIYDAHGSKKEGVDLEIAEELQELNKKLYSKGNASKNSELWKKLRDAEIKACGGYENYKKGRMIYDPYNNTVLPNTSFDFKRFDAWEKRNTREQYKLDENGDMLLFKVIGEKQDEYLKKAGVRRVENAPYQKINEQINKLLQPYRNVNTGEVDIKILPVQVKNRVIELQKQLYDNRRYHFEFTNNKGETVILSDSDKFASTIRKTLSDIFNEYAEQVTTDEYNTGLRKAQTAAVERHMDEDLGYLQSEYLAQNDLPIEVLTYWQETGYVSQYEDSMTGETIYTPHPYRFYTKIMPKEKYRDQFMETVPGDNFIYSKDENQFINKNFDESEEESVIPKKKGTWNGEEFSYDNSEAYNKIQNNKDLKALYDETLDILTEAKDIHNNIPFLSRYHLPAITGDMMDAFKGSTKWQKIYTMYKRFLPWTINETDTDYQRTVATRPDGSELSFIPQPFTDVLDNPQMQSTDLLGIMYLYYLKSIEYREKNKIKDTVESMLDATEDRKFGNEEEPKSGKQSNTYQTLKNHINMMLYEQTNRGKSPQWLKFINSYRSFASTVNLGGSPKVSLVGLLTTMQAHIINGIVGKRYTFTETFKAGIAVLQSLIQSPFRGGLMGYNSRSFQQNLNEEFNLSSQAENKFKHSNRNKILNALTYGFWYGPMTAADWLSKSQILDSVLMDYRFVDGKFVSKQDIVYQYYDRGTFTGGKQYREKLNQWKKGDSLYNILYKAHNSRKRSDQMFTIPEEYKEAYDKIKHVIVNKAQKYSAAADGMLTPNQKAWFMTTWYGALIMMHRQYLPQMIQDRLGQKVWDMDTQEYTYGVYRMLFDLVWAPIKDAWNAYKMLRYNPEPEKRSGLFKSLNSARKAYGSRSKQALIESVTDPINRWALKQVLTEFAIHKMIVLPITSYIVTLADDPDNDDDNLLQLIAYIALSYQWESFSAYRPTDIFNNIMTVTAAQSVTDRLSYVFSNMMSFSFSNNSLLNLFAGGQTGETDEEKENIVKSGVYKGWDRTLMNIFKLTPAHNAYEQWYGSEAKRRYFENQIMKQ